MTFSNTTGIVDQSIQSPVDREDVLKQAVPACLAGDILGACPGTVATSGAVALYYWVQCMG